MQQMKSLTMNKVPGLEQSHSSQYSLAVYNGIATVMRQIYDFTDA